MSRIAMVVGAAAVVGLGGYFGMRAYNASKTPPPVPMGTFAAQTNPPGASVFVDGEAVGKTPLRVSLKAGAHIAEFRDPDRGVPRTNSININPNTETSLIFDLPIVPSTGSLVVNTQPQGARVSVDGVDRGAAPASVSGLTPGEHDVVVVGEGGTPVRQKVKVDLGVTGTILVPVSAASAGPVSGWVSVKAPVTLEIREGGRVIGNSDTDKIMMASGAHTLEFVNETLGYRATKNVTVPPGKVAPLNIDMPKGTININAIPWAEVFIDGKSVGQTPIGNLPIEIGPHEVRFVHPSLGEQRQAISVTANQPARLTADMNKK